MNKEYPNEFQDEQSESIDFVELFFKYLRYWKWFVVSVVVCLAAAYVHLRYSTPVYELKTTVLIKDDKKGGGMDDMKAFQNLGLFDVKNNVDNEVEILKSGTLMEGVVRKMQTYVTYYRIGHIRDVELYGAECPVLFSLPDATLDTLSVGYDFDLNVAPDGQLLFTGRYRKKAFEVHANRYDSVVNLPFGSLHMAPGRFLTRDNLDLHIAVQKPITVALDILSRLSVEVTGKTTSVVNVALKSVHAKRGADLLHTYIDVYNNDNMDDQNLVAQNTATFIEGRLGTITKELSGVEQQVEDYKQREQLTDLTSDAQLLLDKSRTIDAKRIDVETQLSIIQDLERYVNQRENENQLLPAGTGIESTTLNSLIADYNALVLQRNKLSRTAAAGNQAMVDLTEQINALAKNVKASIAREKRSLTITSNDINRQYEQTASLIRSVPRKEREYLEIQRQQSVKSALYLFLLQKKEENFLTMTSVVPKAKIIDQPRSGISPISPKRNMVYLIALVLALAIPVLVLFLRDQLRFYIENKSELEKLSKVPVLGEIPRSGEVGNVVLHEHSVNTLAEMFRLLRTNLLFVMGAEAQRKVILMTSSVGGEGKTFMSINLGLSLAFMKKKVVILGLDLRKPKMAEYLNLDNKSGITLYLSGHLDRKDLIRPSGVHPNLDVIPAGPIPPNPNELLANPELDELIASLKQTYDYILIDSAPVGAVSDTFLLNRFADVALYLVRAEYTHKQNIADANQLFEEGKLHHMYLVLNASDVQKSSYRYGYGKKYGYGGYGNYGEDKG